ncbi:MAG: acyltransferase [Oscillospiraceae bacterium]|nr:acyltransferase [Oscillospiraceae bacterium]
MERKHYDALDGLRTIACIGIVMMHMRANNTYALSGFVYDRLVASFTNFVFLFMLISAFGMCCGYLDKMLSNKVSLDAFYIKRYSKILPFFAVLVLMDVVVSPSKAAVIEGFADLTLLFGFIPKSISVIGVGWFLGVIFAFYLIFPFYCVLLKNRRTAWGAFAVSLALNYVCISYFELGRSNILYCLCYLLAGGLIYLYRDELEQFSIKYWYLCLGAVLGSVVIYYAVGENTVTMLLVSAALLIYALANRKGLLRNRFTKFFSSVSMEVYLSHMFIFRVIEKVGINRAIGNGRLQYAVTVVIVLTGSVIFSVIMKRVLELIGRIIRQKVIEK